MRGRVIASMLARDLEELDEHAARGARVNEGDESLDASSRCAIDELDAVLRQAVERASEVIDLEADVMHRGAASIGQKARDARFGIGRLEQLEPRCAARDERHLHLLVAHLVELADRVAEHVPVERDRLGDRRHDDTDVMERTGAGEAHAFRGSYTPKMPRRSSQISPSVTPARTAPWIGGTRFAVPRAAAARSARARVTAAASRRARNAFTRSIWPFAAASST